MANISEAASIYLIPGSIRLIRVITFFPLLRHYYVKMPEL
jgi:hypothetical protein